MSNALMIKHKKIPSDGTSLQLSLLFEIIRKLYISQYNKIIEQIIYKIVHGGGAPEAPPSLEELLATHSC